MPGQFDNLPDPNKIMKQGNANRKNAGKNSVALAAGAPATSSSALRNRIQNLEGTINSSPGPDNPIPTTEHSPDHDAGTRNTSETRNTGEGENRGDTPPGEDTRQNATRDATPGPGDVKTAAEVPPGAIYLAASMDIPEHRRTARQNGASICHEEAAYFIEPMHPNIPALRDAGLIVDDPVGAMRTLSFAKGKEMRDSLTSRGAMSDETALVITRGMSRSEFADHLADDPLPEKTWVKLPQGMTVKDGIENTLARFHKDTNEFYVPKGTSKAAIEAAGFTIRSREPNARAEPVALDTTGITSEMRVKLNRLAREDDSPLVKKGAVYRLKAGRAAPEDVKHLVPAEAITSNVDLILQDAKSERFSPQKRVALNITSVKDPTTDARYNVVRAGKSVSAEVKDMLTSQGNYNLGKNGSALQPRFRAHATVR